MAEKQLKDQIRNITKNSRISYPDNYDAFICKVLEELPEESEESERRSRWRRKNRKVRWIPVPAFILGVFVVIIAGVSVGAVVRGYLCRMKAMSEEQREEYVAFVEESEMDGDSFSRELSESEQKRGRALAVEYEAGDRYPKQQIPVLEDETSHSDYRMCFVRTNSTFFLPDDELTDEELLEIIEFYYKREYSMKARKTVEETKLSSEEKGKIKRKEAIKLAKDYIKDIYDIDVSGWNCQAEKYMPYHLKQRYYLVSFWERDSQQSLLVEIKEKTRQCTELLMEVEKESREPDSISVTQKEIMHFQNKASDILKKLDKEIEIEEIQCQYIQKKSGIPIEGNIDFIYSQENGQGYILKYCLRRKIFYSISYCEDVSEYIDDYRNRAKRKRCEVKHIMINESNVAEKEAE